MNRNSTFVHTFYANDLIVSGFLSKGQVISEPVVFVNGNKFLGNFSCEYSGGSMLYLKFSAYHVRTLPKLEDMVYNKNLTPGEMFEGSVWRRIIHVDKIPFDAGTVESHLINTMRFRFQQIYDCQSV